MLGSSVDCCFVMKSADINNINNTIITSVSKKINTAITTKHQTSVCVCFHKKSSLRLFKKLVFKQKCTKMMMPWEM